MSIIPLHIQRLFEQRWAAQFGSRVIPAVPKNVGLKGSPVNVRRARQSQRKTLRLELAALKSASEA
jgi:hypothetical protein